MRYEIVGEATPAVICHLDDGETMITEKGSMVWMTPNIKMETNAGGVKKAFGKMITGEALFQNKYTAKSDNGLIAFASSFPGQIKAVEVHAGKPIIAQKSAFLASEKGIELSTFFQKKISSGFWGGEGFIMQKISGHGTVFLEIDGYAVEYTLGVGEQMIVDTGNLAMMDSTCKISVEMVKGAKNLLFGGEGMFNTVVTGPGRIILQTMPMSGFVEALKPFFPSDKK